jgi:hypothetical protein
MNYAAGDGIVGFYSHPFDRDTSWSATQPNIVKRKICKSQFNLYTSTYFRIGRSAAQQVVNYRISGILSETQIQRFFLKMFYLILARNNFTNFELAIFNFGDLKTLANNAKLNPR